jgi:hypothetical protein
MQILEQTAAAESCDVIWGAANIARFLNCPARRAFYLLEKRLIPGRKVGDSWVSTRTELRAAMRGENVPANSNEAA